MSKTATIYTIPEKRVVVMDGRIVGFVSSDFRAQDVAKRYGAEKVEKGEWEDILTLPTCL